MPLQKMSPWPTDYFELSLLKKLFLQEGSSDHVLFLLKQEIKPPCEKCAPCTRRVEDILITRLRNLGPRGIHEEHLSLLN